MRSVTFVAAPAVLKQKPVLQAKRSVFLQLIAPTAFAAESEDGSEYYISVTIPTGFWVDDVGGRTEFDFGEDGITITLDESLPGKKTAEDYTHECPSLDENCNCTLINPSAEEIEAAYQAAFGKMYDNITEEEFFKWATSPDYWWQDEQNIEQKVKKSGTSYIITDTKGNKINLGTLMVKCEAWVDALMQGLEKANEYLLDCKMIARGKMPCDKENPQHAWQDFTCGENTGKICLNNSAHSEGTTAHDFSSSPWVNNGSAGHSRTCACGQSSSGVIAHTFAPSGDKTWNESRTGWTQKTECICGIQSEISHVCEHVYCDPCSAGDGCDEPCPTCKGKHQYVKTTSESCIECLCEGCHIHPGDDINKHTHWLPCEEHPQDETENERGKGEHCVCGCGLFSCADSKWSKKTPRGTVHNFGTRVTTHSRTTNDPIKYEQIMDGVEPDPEQHWSCAKSECERCQDPYGVREDHEWGEEEEPHYKKLSNEKCALRKVCSKCQFEIYQTEEEAGAHIEDATIKAVYEELENGTQHRKTMTCIKCKNPFYEDKDHAYIEDVCGNKMCVCGKRSPDQTSEVHKGWTDNGEDTHTCACKKQTVAHTFGEWEIISETDTSAMWQRICADCGRTETKETEKDENGNLPHPSDIMCTPEKHNKRYQECGCVCAYYSNGEKVLIQGTDREVGSPAATDDFHFYVPADWMDDTVDDCTCLCGTRHQFRAWAKKDLVAASRCVNICAGCLKYHNGGDMYNKDNQIATLEDHTPRDNQSEGGIGCGCCCGSFNQDTANDVRFHPKHPNTCRCYGSITDGVGNGSWHYPYARTDCNKICSYQNSDGTTHLANTGTKPIKLEAGVTLAQEKDHTAKSNTCGCECGAYSPTKANLSPTSPLHVKADYLCGCWCGGAAKSCFPEWHTWSEGYCWCQEIYTDFATNAAHRIVANPNGNSCTNVCWGSNHDGHGSGHEVYNNVYYYTDEAGKLKHTPKDDGCGCVCGQFDSRAYGNAKTDEGEAAFHNGHGSDHGGYKCYCSCGLLHKFFEEGKCPSFCDVCTLTKDGKYSSRSTEEEALKLHTFEEKCVCNCGETTREHLLSEWQKYENGTSVCSKCGKTITQYYNYRTCTRSKCEYVEHFDSSYGHGEPCTSDTTKTYCRYNGVTGCQCENCYCASCTDYRNDGTKGGTCSTCKQTCGTNEDSSDSGSSGEGGETGGDGGLDDI